MGKVYLIGAGCGSYDLITLRGYQLLQKAECVLFDRLIDPQLLQLLPSGCERIHVGKKNHHHTMPQADIEQLLIQKAMQHEIVIRLKGGDPYVFGRGGEEALALYRAKIPFEVVPGISSCIASLTYAGFPITQRGINRGFRVYSAHTKEDEISELDYASMANSKDTLVFLMGLKHCKELFQGLLDHGKDKNTPVALISNGARFDQHVVTSTLQNIVKDLPEMQSPCTIVVGEVISLREQLQFFEQKPLLQKRILIPVLNKETQGDLLREQGAMVEEVQVGRIEAIHEPVDLDILSSITYLIFTSRHGVFFFMRQMLESGRDARNLAHLKIACIGQKTAAALRTFGLQSDFISTQSDSSHMAEELKEILRKDDHILIAKAENNNHVLEDALKDHQVTLMKLYHSTRIPYAVLYDRYDAMIFTSAFHVHACKDLLSKAAHIFSIGPHTSKALRGYGIEPIESRKADKQALWCLVRKELTRCIEEED